MAETQPTESTETAPEETVPTGKSFTQEELDKIVQDRVTRERKKFPDYDTYKDAASRLAQMEDDQKSEIQKAQDRAAEAERRAGEREQKAQEALLRSSVFTEATTRNVVDPEAAFALMDRTSLTFDDDGSPTNVSEVMDTLLQSKTWLVGTTTPRPGAADQGARTSSPEQVTREALSQMTPDQIVQAQAEGRLTKVLAS